MQVICPKCQSCFLLPPGVKTGTRLRCSVCRHEFSYTGPDVPHEPVQKAGALSESCATPSSAGTQPQPVQGQSSAQASSDQPLNFEPASSKEVFLPKSGDLPVLGAKEKKSHAGLWFGLLILICLAGVAAWFAVPEFRSALLQYKEGLFAEDSATQAPDTLAKAESAVSAPQQEQPAAVCTDTLVFENTGNRYVENDHIGRLLIIEGRIKNTGDTAYGNIMLHAALLDKDRKAIDKADQVAGPVLTDIQLKVMTRAEMIKALNEEQGGSGVVAKGGTVPFMIIFCNPSDDLSEFSVKIGKAEKAAADTAPAQPSGTAEPAVPVQPAAPVQPDASIPDAPQMPAPSVPAPAAAPMAPASGQPQNVPQAVPPSVQPTVQ